MRRRPDASRGVVYGLLRTRDAASPAVGSDQVLTSLVMFSLIYLALFALWLYVINEKVRHGPPEPAPDAPASKSMIRAAAAVGLGRGGEQIMRREDD